MGNAAVPVTGATVPGFETSLPARTWGTAVGIAAGFCFFTGVVSLLLLYDFHTGGIFEASGYSRQWWPARSVA